MFRRFFQRNEQGQTPTPQPSGQPGSLEALSPEQVVSLVMQLLKKYSHTYVFSEQGRAEIDRFLVKTRCPYDEKTQSRVGKKRVIGRVAGQMTEAIYALLKHDAELLLKVLPGQDPPPPMLYDPEVHQQHHQAHYRPLKSTPLPNTITVLHPLSSE
jgi:hypothetical protein